MKIFCSKFRCVHYILLLTSAMLHLVSSSLSPVLIIEVISERSMPIFNITTITSSSVHYHSNKILHLAAQKNLQDDLHQVPLFLSSCWPDCIFNEWEYSTCEFLNFYLQHPPTDQHFTHVSCYMYIIYMYRCETMLVMAKLNV